MSNSSLNETLKQGIVLEEKKYADTLKADAELHVLKSIRERIKKTKGRICGGHYIL